MEISRKTLFESETLQIGLFEARPRSDACGDVERQDRNAVVLPLSGVFAKHEAPGRHVIGTPSHAVFFCRRRAVSNSGMNFNHDPQPDAR